MNLSLGGMGLRPPPCGLARDPGLFGPGSEMWRIARERVLLAAGPAALLLQVAHPLVAEAVAAHSDFRRDPLRRLRATLDATLTVSFGDALEARAASSRVAATHRSVHGRLPGAVGRFDAGTPYDAGDPALALWVHTTLVWMALDGYHLLVRRLTRLDRSRYYEESKSFARLFGVTDVILPATYDDLLSYRDSMIDGPAITVGDAARGLARDILRPSLPGAARRLSRPLETLTAGLLPERLRRAFGLSWTHRDRVAFRVMASSSRAAVTLLPNPLRFWPHYREAVRRVDRGERSRPPGLKTGPGR